MRSACGRLDGVILALQNSVINSSKSSLVALIGDGEDFLVPLDSDYNTWGLRPVELAVN